LPPIDNADDLNACNRIVVCVGDRSVKDNVRMFYKHPQSRLNVRTACSEPGLLRKKKGFALNPVIIAFGSGRLFESDENVNAKQIFSRLPRPGNVK